MRIHCRESQIEKLITLVQLVEGQITETSVYAPFRFEHEKFKLQGSHHKGINKIPDTILRIVCSCDTIAGF